MIEGNSAVWQNASGWVRKVVKLRPDVAELWDDLSSYSAWNVRWRVACVLYHDIADHQSDALFAALRHDKSIKVRTYAIDRYEYRPGPDREAVKMFDADAPSSPGFHRGN